MSGERTRQSKKNGEHCLRCGGLMFREFTRVTGSVEWHCVMCGERVDEVILAHRRQREAQKAAGKLFAVAV